MIAQELTKLALYLDASPTSPKDLGRDVLDASGTDMGGDFLGIADLALAGDVPVTRRGTIADGSSGKEAIPIIRSLQRRLLMLVPIRSRIDGGERLQAVMTSMGKSLFWKDKPMVEKMLAIVGFRWPGTSFRSGLVRWNAA
jgi:DNA polymerase-3 subunit delta